MSTDRLRALLAAPARWLANVFRGRGGPPEAGVREPRRPKPTLPGAAVALAEPRTGIRRWLHVPDRLGGGHSSGI